MPVKQTLLRSAAFSAFLSGVCLSCGSGDDDGPALGQEQSWREQATEINDLTCQRIYECFPTEFLEAVRTMVPQTGNSVEECQANMRRENADATAPCRPPQSFHSDLADQCLTVLEEASCQQFMTGLASGGGPEPCPSVCS